MPETFKEYITWEVALGIRNNRDLADGHERTQEGDIVAVRKPIGRIGVKERSQFLWLRVEGLDNNGMDPLAGVLQENGTVFEKRRYSIPFDRLPISIDLARVRDPADIYQPFMLIDEDSGNIIDTARSSPLNVSGLVFDKQTRKFL